MSDSPSPSLLPPQADALAHALHNVVAEMAGERIGYSLMIWGTKTKAPLYLSNCDHLEVVEALEDMLRKLKDPTWQTRHP